MASYRRLNWESGPFFNRIDANEAEELVNALCESQGWTVRDELVAKYTHKVDDYLNEVLALTEVLKEEEAMLLGTNSIS